MYSRQMKKASAERFSMQERNDKLSIPSSRLT